MRAKSRLAKAALVLPVIGIALAAVLLCSGQSASTRSARINATAVEIRRGNYCAWGQLLMWLEKLTPDETKLLKDACAEYAGTNRYLKVAISKWPPEKFAARTTTAADWMKSVLGMEDNQLFYNNLACPVSYDIEVRNFFHIYQQPTRYLPRVAAVPQTDKVLMPSATPGR